VLENIFKNPIFDKINSISVSIMNVLMPILHPYIDELKDFQFRIANPLFWFFVLIVLFFLNCFWRFKKAFLFCLLTALILLITTALENSMAEILTKSVLFDHIVLRYISLFLILGVFLYFFFIRLD